MGLFAVIDTETNWFDQVMSVGIVLADERTMEQQDSRYYILSPEAEIGGMYSGVMGLIPEEQTTVDTRDGVMEDICDWLRERGVRRMFAYNACFDCKHLPELSHLQWYDIMKIAAYRQYNAQIPASAPCCSTGRLKSHYGVEPMLQLLSGRRNYAETHNALHDAEDELTIMKLLGRSIAGYECARLR